MDDKELERLAQEELLQEAKRGQKRAEVMGPVGWQRCPLPTTNKRFLHNVLASTLEPRKKKPRQTDTKQSPTGSKEKTYRNQDSKDEKKQRGRSKSQKISSHKSEHKRRSDESTHKHHSSKRRAKDR